MYTNHPGTCLYNSAYDTDPGSNATAAASELTEDGILLIYPAGTENQPTLEFTMTGDPENPLMPASDETIRILGAYGCAEPTD